jgi:hypothetical protein
MKDLVKGGKNFFTVACSCSQGTGACVLVQVLGNRTFQSYTNGKNKMLLGVVKELGLVLWHRCLWEIRHFSMSTEENTSKIKQNLRWHE